MQEYYDIICKNPGLLLACKSGITILVTTAAYFLSKVLMHSLEVFAKEKTKWTYDDEIIGYLKKPVRRLVILIGANFLFSNLTPILGDKYGLYIAGIFYLLIIGQIMLAVMQFVTISTRVYLEKYFDSRQQGGKEEFVPLIGRIIKIIVFIIALITVMKHFNQDVQSLVVSLGVGSLAIALAAQETLSNMIAGFVIMTDRPFRVGDRIQLSSGEKGDVYEIGLRTTKLMTFDNTLIIVPNAEMVKMKVTNLTYPDPVTRVKITVGVAYGTDLDKVKKILTEVCKGLPDVQQEPEPQAYFLNFGESSLDFQVTFYVPDWKMEWPLAEKARIEINRRFTDEGIEIPYPQRVIWMGKQS